METLNSHTQGHRSPPGTLNTPTPSYRGSSLDRVMLPLPPAMGEETRFEMEIYARFMRHLRQVPNSRMEIKILSSIQFTADMLDVADAMVAKTLVDLGLRAPRKAFPVSFLDFADKAVQRMAWDQTAMPLAVLSLKQHWDLIGEDRFAGAVRDTYSVFNDSVLSRA